jgi:hypothetical protein
MKEVLSSQRQMMVRDGKQDDQVPDEKLADLYEGHLQKIETWLDQQPNMSTLYISYNEILQDPETQLSRLNQFLGGQLSMQQMMTVIDQNLYRERRAG